jgi:hypothetical protein
LPPAHPRPRIDPLKESWWNMSIKKQTIEPAFIVRGRPGARPKPGAEVESPPIRKATPEAVRDGQTRFGKVGIQTAETRAIDAEMKRRGRHVCDPQQFAMMERLYGILEKKGVKPEAIALEPTPGEMGFDEMVCRLRVPKKKLDKRGWSAIEDYLIMRATDYLSRVQSTSTLNAQSRPKPRQRHKRRDIDPAADTKTARQWDAFKSSRAQSIELFAGEHNRNPDEVRRALDRDRKNSSVKPN